MNDRNVSGARPGAPEKILVIPNEIKDPGFVTTKALCRRLALRGAAVILPERLSEAGIDGAEISGESEAFREADMVITLGGDGTLLSCTYMASVFDKPVLGINMGRVGFLAELEKNEIDAVDGLFSGNYRIDERMRLAVDIEKPTGTVSGTVLNDCCISASSNSRVVEFDLYCSDEYRPGGCKESIVSHYRADGMIFSTPTGSTAYALSAGGVPCDPSCRLICATPICSHSLVNSTPLIFSEKNVLRVRNIDGRDARCFAALDGSEAMKNGENVLLEPGDTVTVRCSDKKTKLVRLMNRPFYDVLFRKF